MISDLTPYPAMKDSGVEWLGKVPEHWEVMRGKVLFRCIDARSATGEEDLLTVSSDRGIVPRESAAVTMFRAASYVGHKLCWPGDLVINSLWAWSRGLGVSRYHGIVSTAYGVYRLRRPLEVSAAYIEKLVRSTPFNWELRVRSKGIWISRLQLTDDAFLGAPFPIPPVGEQAAIVRFLDHVERRIRRYIRAKERLIKLLEDQKQAIINQAVTGQIDVRTGRPYPAYRDSGVEWLGKVPQHWETRRLKWVTRLQRGYDLPADKRVPGPFPVVSSGGIIDTHFESRCAGPGVVMGRYGSTDAVYYLERDFWPHNTSLFVTNFYGNMKKWCYYLLTNITKADHASKSAVPGLDRKDLFQIIVPVPPLAEQMEAVKVIETAGRNLTTAITTTERKIAVIREYRTRLIADVVTGKLDVREAAAGLPDVGRRSTEDDPDDGLNYEAGSEAAVWQH